MKKTTALDKAKLIARLATEKKGENIVVMEIKNISAMCDCFVLVSASSSRRVHAISNNIQENLSKIKISPLSIEGKRNPYWVLLDYDDVVVHIFHRDIRDFYGLERLWSDAPTERV